MKTSFRQGITRFQATSAGQQTFLQKETLAGNYIDLNVTTDPTVITFAHGESNYSIEETKSVSRAWGPFTPTGQTQYLYWDINLLTGVLSRSFTLIAPIVGMNTPLNPQVDQHWFDKNTNFMKVWNGTSWVVKVRVFAAVYDSNAIIIASPLGTQVGLNTPAVSGSILFDDQHKPIRQSNQQFMTTESSFTIKSETNNSFAAMQFETLVKFAAAVEYIPKFHCVSYSAEDKIALGSYANTSRLIAGLVREDTYPNEVVRIYTGGIVNNEQWNFPSTSIGKPLFCGEFGDVTLTPPQSGVVQMIGTVTSRTSINLEIQSPIYY